MLEPSSAQILSRFTNTTDHSPAVTVNKFGKGNAVYLATESTPSAIGPLLIHLYKLVGVQLGPQSPEGVFARVIDGRTLYVNTTNHVVIIPIAGPMKRLLTSRTYEGKISLGQFESDLVQ